MSGSARVGEATEDVRETAPAALGERPSKVALEPLVADARGGARRSRSAGR